MYINQDKNPRQIRLEIQTRRLARLLERAHPDHGEFKSQRALGRVNNQAQPVARLFVGDTREAPTTIEWKPAALTRIGIDRVAIRAQFDEQLTPADASDWCL